MFSTQGELFELRENEIMFQEICQKLKNHSFESPWALCFNAQEEVGNFDCEVKEFNFSEIDFLEITNEQNKSVKNSIQSPTETVRKEQNAFDIDKKFHHLKTCLMSVQDIYQVEQIKDIDLISSVPLFQIPQFCEYVYNAFLNESSVALFLNAILNLEKPLSITVAAALINHIVFPKILSFKSSNCRNISLSLLNFFRIYPKAIIDEILVPCLKRDYLETPLQEILLKVLKSNLSNEHVAYCIRSILDGALPSENTFLILQNLIEKKIPYDSSLQDAIAFTLENWVSISSINMKFTKLLISILSIYGSELTEQQMKIYSDAVRVNKTIMKRAAENVMKKLKIV